MAERMRWFDRRAFGQAVRAATQWRLLLLWVGVSWLPAAIVALPLWRGLGGLLDHSVHAQAWAERLDVLAFGDALRALAPASGMLAGSAIVGLLASVLLNPFLNGMAVGSALAGRSPGFGDLLRQGVIQYPRMFRLLLWSILVYGAVAAVAVGALALAGDVAQRALLEASADRAFGLAVAVIAVLYVLVQVVLDGARAVFMVDAGLGSARRALGRGMRLLRRPLPTLGYFLAVSVAGYAAALVLALFRAQLPRGHVFELGLAVLLAQLIVLAIGWTHVARLFVLAVVARERPPEPAASAGEAASPAVPAGE